MAFMVLVSTMSFTISKHYCGDTLVDIAVFQKAKGCGMEKENSSNEGCFISKKNCCNDKQLVVKGQDELQTSIDKVSLEQQAFISSFVYSYINLFESLDKNVSTFEGYIPPLVVRQIFKIDETYLI